MFNFLHWEDPFHFHFCFKITNKSETKKWIYCVYVKLFQFQSFELFLKNIPLIFTVTFKYLQKGDKKKKLGTVQILCPFFFIKMIPFILSQGKQRSHHISINLVSPILFLIHNHSIIMQIMQPIWYTRPYWLTIFSIFCCQELIFSLPGFTGFVFAQIAIHQYRGYDYL